MVTPRDNRISVLESWEAFSKQLFPAGIPNAVQEQEMRKAFYGGYAGGLGMVDKLAYLVAKGETTLGRILLEMQWFEIKDYAEGLEPGPSEDYEITPSLARQTKS